MSSLPMAMIDILFLSIIFICALRGCFWGFYRELLPFFVWLLIAFVNVYYGQSLAKLYLLDFFEPHTAYVVSELLMTLVLLFFGFICVLGLKVFLVYSTVTLFNRMLGLFVSSLRGCLIVLVIMHIVMHTGYAKKVAWQQSIIVDQFTPILTKLDADIINDESFSDTKLPENLDTSGVAQ